MIILREVIASHNEWLESNGEKGVRANLRNVDLREANLRNANLRNANLEDADLRWANLRWANLRWANLRWANLEDADLRGANLEDADLRGADLEDADLRGAHLCSANLRRANLRRANLREADLCNANLVDADLEDAKLCSPIRMLEARWGEVSDDLTTYLMRLDASGHPEGSEAFARWAAGGPCPYDGGMISRIANFKGKRELWSAGDFPSIWDLVKMLLKEKTRTKFAPKEECHE